MSALTPHIRVLRAEADQLDERAAEYEALPPTVERTTLVVVLRATAKAKRDAAAVLEAEESAAEEKLRP